MMKAPGSLSFSRAMAAGESGRAQRWHLFPPVLAMFPRQLCALPTQDPGVLYPKLQTQIHCTLQGLELLYQEEGLKSPHHTNLQLSGASTTIRNSLGSYYSPSLSTQSIREIPVIPHTSQPPNPVSSTYPAPWKCLVCTSTWKYPAQT